MSQYWSPLVHRLTPYTPGEQPKLSGLIKLNTNENPYPPSPQVVAAIERELAAQQSSLNGAGENLRLYPDPNADQLKAAIAQQYGEHGITPQQVFVGNGSDEVLAHVFMALLQHDAPLLFPDITYSFYPVYCSLYQIEYRTLPLDEQFRIRVADYWQAIEARALTQPDKAACGGIIFPNPNAPTGCLLPLHDIERLLQKQRDSVLVIDEAYIDFGGESAISLVNRYANLLVVQTFSKSRALAGLRVGYAVGNAALIEALERIKNSFNSYPLDRLALVGATAALADQSYFLEKQQAVIASRAWLVSALQTLGFTVLPSAANFVFARHAERNAADLAAFLRTQKIIVRHFKQDRIESFLRISIGTPEQCAALVDALHVALA
ncbi:MAG: histidinol-phosphate transaminase [Pseudomonadota bacterium]